MTKPFHPIVDESASQSRSQSMAAVTYLDLSKSVKAGSILPCYTNGGYDDVLDADINRHAINMHSLQICLRQSYSMLLTLLSRRFVTVMVCLLLLTVTQAAHAVFSLTFQGVVQTLNTGGSITLNSPSAMVVDSSGNIYVTDTGNSRIVEVSAQGTASVLTISGLSPALVAPTGIAIDGSGNLYVTDADPANSRVVKITSSGAGSVISTGSVTLSSPKGLALDQSGDIFIADTGNSRIVEVTAGGSAAALSITGLSSPSSLHTPTGLAVDVSGNLYIVDSGNDRIVKMTAGSTAGAVVSIAGGVTLNTPSGIAVDGIGNIFIADTGNNRIAEVDTAGNGAVLFTSSVTLSGPLGVAVNAFGTVSIADTSDNRVLIVNPPVNADVTASDPTYSLNNSAVGFGHVQLGSSSSVTLTLQFTTGAVGLGAVKVRTSGTENLDFTSGPDTTCISSTAASTSCFVQVKFLPTAPGLRKGAVVLYDASQNPILTIPLYGFSDAPVAALTPNSGMAISTGAVAISNPFQGALDGAGNMYVGNYNGKNVIKIPAGGGSASVLSLGTPGGTALQNITGVAVDGAGNLFIGDHQNSRVLVMTPGGAVSVLSINGLSQPLGYPTALAFDAAGNLYIADFMNGRIVEISSLVVAGSTSSGKGTTIGTGSYSFSGSTLTGLAVDSQGTIYAAARTQNNSSIVKITAAGVASLLPLTNGVTISNPQGVAVDAMGNIYIVDTSNKRIVKVTTAGATSTLSLSGLSNPSSLGSTLFGVTADPSGNLYIPDWTNNRIVFVNVSGSDLTFASTNVGSTSGDSPKTATVTNIGNQPLVFSAVPTFTADFSENGSDTNPCNSSTIVLSGMNCDVAIKFTPQSSGGLSANIVVTDNALNIANSAQQIAVSGTAINAGDITATTISITPSSAVYGQAVTIVAKIVDTQSGHTTTIPTGSVTFIDASGSTISQLSSVTIDASGNATLTGVVLNGLGIHTITASYAGVANTFLASNGTGTMAVNQASVTVGGPAQPVSLLSGQAGSVAITVKGAFSTLSAPSGVVNYSLLNSSNTSVSSGTAALTAGSGGSAATISIPGTLAPGSYTISVNYAGDTNYQSAALAVSLSVGKLASALSLVSSANPTIVTSAVTFTATITSSSGTPTGTVSFSDGTALLGTGTLSQGRASYTTASFAAGSHSIAAAYSGDSNFTASISSAVVQLVQDFSLGTPSSGTTNAPSTTVPPGGTATYTLSFGPSTGTVFPAPVTLSLSGLPPGATATLSPQTLPAGSSLSSVTLTIQVPQQTSELHRDLRLAAPALALLLLPFAGRMRRTGKTLQRLSFVLLLLIAGAGATVGLTGCGAKASGFFGQAEKTYNVLITATSGSLSHSTSVTLIVQ